MSALQLIQWVHHATWLVLAAIALVRLARHPTRANLDIALFFGAIAAFVLLSRAPALVSAEAPPWALAAARALVIAAPYLLLRVVGDLVGVAGPVRATALAGLVPAVALTVASGASSLPPVAVLYVVGYFGAVSVYAAYHAATAGRAFTGVTRQRLGAIAVGAYVLGIAVLAAGIGAVAPDLETPVSALTQVLAVLSALAFYVGFAAPNALRRYWQLPELRAFLERASTLPGATMSEIVADLEGVAGRAFGAAATIGIWDERAGVLRFGGPHGGLPREMGPSAFVAWRVFEARQAVYVADAARANPANAEGYRRAGIGAILVAPITAGPRRIGVLEVFAQREPIFVEDDLGFVQLIARQAAVLLEARALIDDAARVRAQEETARLKEDFVSAAAHDLKTPLTTIVGQAQLLEWRAEREGRTAELEGLRRLVRETAQLSRLVEELLDASRIERGAFEAHLEECDLAEIVRESARRELPGSERIEVLAGEPIPGLFDPQRMRQLVDNLVENALKYSPAESPVGVRAWARDGRAEIAVSDRGIGIPAEDLPHVFERFRRGTNVDHRRFSGIGLGLYICRGIAEQHGGSISAESAPGRGTTFRVSLPLRAAGGATMDGAAKETTVA